ncbi:lauroyl acyltransferase [Lacibacterium aquatile]|uniref:Lauroyl acyltransferase n=1 Tax=Lacibacterium aquatile TaxID=1168082 RepID=A0ABW5DT49_9PROT
MKRLRHLIEAGVVLVLLGIFKMLTLDAASAFGGWIARKVGPLTSADRIARRNLARFMPEMGAAERNATIRDLWDNLGRTFGEYPHLAQIAAERVEVTGTDIVARLREDGMTGICFSGHLANWELLPIVAAQQGVELTGVYRRPNNPFVDRIVLKLREPAGGRLVPKGSEGAREILKAMLAGQHLGLLIDQKMNDGMAVPFFGTDAMTAPAAAQLALRFKCPLVPVHPVRLQGANFRLDVLEPLVLPASGNKNADSLALMSEINRLLEAWIRENPAQWLWIHNRWPKSKI